jgi:hypothetical protein
VHLSDKQPMRPAKTTNVPKENLLSMLSTIVV